MNFQKCSQWAKSGPFLFGLILTSEYIAIHRATVFIWTFETYIIWTVFGPLWTNWEPLSKSFSSVCNGNIILLLVVVFTEIKSGSLCQNLSSSDHMLQQLSLCCYMDVKHVPSRWLLHSHVKSCLQHPLEAAYNKRWFVCMVTCLK